MNVSVSVNYSAQIDPRTWIWGLSDWQLMDMEWLVARDR